MNAFARSIIAGAFGALTVNVLHQIVRQATADAPRVDLLGMQALAKSAEAVAIAAPTGRRLYLTTLAADLVSNTAYFALTGFAPRQRSIAGGTLLGIAAGLGAVLLPGPLGLASRPTSRTARTRVLTVALYSAGGIVAGTLLRDPAERVADAEFFAKKHVLITGGTRGLGFILAQRLLHCGANVTICGRSPDALHSAVAKLGTEAGSLCGFVCDVRDRTACEHLIAQSVERHGPVDILINNAGIIQVGPLAEQTFADFAEALDTHFWAPLYTAFAVLPSMRNRRTGSIVNISSIGGIVGVPHLAPYSASKFAQVGLTQALGAEVASDGVRVSSVTPGLMITGSPDHAIFKGRNRAEYAWFTLSDANPLISVSVDAAARRILRGIRRGEAQITIGWTAQAAKTLNALFPETTMALLRFAAKLLPPPGGVGTDRREGSQSRSPWTQNPLTLLNSRAMRRANQEPSTSD